jgi:hypothetical protein
MLIKKKDKRGFGPLIIPIILIGLVVGAIAVPSIATFFTGLFGGSKVSGGLASIPTWFWVVLIFILFLILLNRRKR